MSEWSYQNTPVGLSEVIAQDPKVKTIFFKLILRVHLDDISCGCGVPEIMKTLVPMHTNAPVPGLSKSLYSEYFSQLVTLQNPKSFLIVPLG